MHILIVNTRHYLGGGDSTYAFNLTDLLRERGHKVSFFAMQGKNNLPDAHSDLFVSFIDYRALNQSKNLVTGLRVFGRSIYSREARTKFAQLVEQVQPDIVHLHNIHAHITPSIILEARRRRLPVVWTLHDYKLICPNSHFLIDQTMQICEACQGGKFWQAVVKCCKKGSLPASSMAALEAYVHQAMGIRSKIDAFLCPSSFLRQKLIANGFNGHKTHHLPLFLQTENFRESERDDGYLLFLGKLEALKGIHLLIDAARLIPDTPLILAGRAEEPLVSQLNNLPANIKYVGFKSGAELNALRNHARAIILPSLWYENQPLSILEAFASGKPVIASNLGGMSELIGNDERGWLVAPGNVPELAQTMQSAVADPDQARVKGNKAYLYALQNHNPQEHYTKLSLIYNSML